MRCTDIIAQDHAALRRGVDILDRMVQRMEEGNRIEIFDIRTVLKFLRAFGDSYHLSTEERELLSVIEADLNAKHGIGFVRSSRRIILLLRNHLEKEDLALADIGERLLSKNEDDVIAATFASNRAISDIVVGFSRLERKYAPNPRSIPAEMDRRAHA